MSVASSSRNLVFRWRPSKLTQDIDLMLVFTPPKDSMLNETENVVVWKRLQLNAYPTAQNLAYATINYEPDYGFGASVKGENGANVTSVLPIDVGKTTDLVLTKCGNPLFTEPTKSDSERSFQATNTTGNKQWMSIGTIDKQEAFNPTYTWQVEHGMTVKADLQPVLMGFVNMGYRESEFITADITSKAMWSENLTDLPENTTWEVQEMSDGKYTIERVN